MNAWPDRRSIARLDLAIEGERSPANPRAWHGVFHRGLDARKADYIPAFAETFLPWWEQRLDYAVENNSQGAWVLDGDGRENDQPTSWLGNWWTCAPPEMTVDLRRKMVKACKDRKLWFGVTVRHSVPLMLANRTVSQVLVTDPATAIVANIQATRWGLGSDLESTYRFNYFDSNVIAESDGVRGCLPAKVMADIQKRVGGFLLMPEFGSTAPPKVGDKGYLAVPRVAPWRDANAPADATTLAAAKLGAFEIIMPPHGGWTPTPDDESRLAAEVKAGHVVVFTGSWAAPENEWLLRAARGK